uniref:Uncharacterized protein n=1 Tax=Cyclopterus lumpus TaxID=8103 RepID=A0A8C3A7L5_CYCLU
MKTEPTGIGAGIMDLIPRSCRFPPDVNHVTQVLNMDHLQKADMRPGLLSSDCGETTNINNGIFFAVPDHSTTAISTGYRRSRPQGVLHKASGSTLSGPPPQTGRKSSAASDGMDKNVLFFSNVSHTNIQPDMSCITKVQNRTSALTAAESLSYSICPAFSGDLQVWSSWESNEGPEPQLTLQGEVFTFSSQPHSPKPGQGQGNQEKTEMGDDQVRNKNVRRTEAQLEDDFIGSESDEVRVLTLDVQREVHPESHNIDQITPKELNPATTGMLSPSSARAEPAGIAPTRCLSPSRQEVKCGTRGSEVVNQVVDENSSVIVLKAEDNNTLKPVDSSDYNLHMLSRLRMHGDDDHELRMLASLKREQDKYECRASGLSASQIHHCNVSISMSSDDASTWTHISTPANQGRDESVKDEEKEDEYLNLLYDPCLNCYFDPKTGKYYELA